jgi:hypothetical protein
MSSEINSRYYHKFRKHEPIMWKTANSQKQEKIKLVFWYYIVLIQNINYDEMQQNATLSK